MTLSTEALASVLQKKIVIVGGCGAVGGLFISALQSAGAKLISSIDCELSSERQPDVSYFQGDIASLNDRAKNEIRNADVLIFALPETVFLESLEKLSVLFKSDILLIDTLSVKTPVEVIYKSFPASVELLSINPMFAPILGFEGQSIAAVVFQGGESVKRFVALLESWGSSLSYLSATEHDRMTAALQVATHASILSFGMALAALDYDIDTAEQLMPPPHKLMLALLARILSADSEVYRDIQASSPYAAEARTTLLASMESFSSCIEDGGADNFAGLFAEMIDIFGGRRADYAELCQKIFLQAL